MKTPADADRMAETLESLLTYFLDMSAQTEEEKALEEAIRESLAKYTGEMRYLDQV